MKAMREYIITSIMFSSLGMMNGVSGTFIDETVGMTETNLTSPGYVDGVPYDVYSNRTYRYTTNYQHHILVLTIHEFILEQEDKKHNCLYDRLTIYDGYNESYPNIAILCDNITAGTEYKTTGRFVYAIFESDHDYNYKGFSIGVRSDGPTTTTSTTTSTTSSTTTSRVTMISAGKINNINTVTSKLDITRRPSTGRGLCPFFIFSDTQELLVTTRSHHKSYFIASECITIISTRRQRSYYVNIVCKYSQTGHHTKVSHEFSEAKELLYSYTRSTTSDADLQLGIDIEAPYQTRRQPFQHVANQCSIRRSGHCITY